ncbi:helix-turn-helix domain-containing protein [Crocinitomix catalasitica]|uniref:helix-turn-helix domain-containing protein n=1 Tax=Crocinitomix catalasitica TaxID=184607 RepID=UPI0005692ED5|nr:helix-turn-helix transcriptional regulator [Crocinitomix catalasitica]
MKTKKIKTYSLEEVTDKYIGEKGTTKRDEFENELQLDLIGEAIKRARKERNLTQAQLGALVGVQKAQISKLENHLTDARFETILKVFKALNAKINFNVELLNQNVKLT